MAKMNLYEDIKLDKIKNIQLHIEDNSKTVNDIVNSIIKSYSADLDDYVLFIKECLADGQNPPTDAELDDFCLNLSTYIYFAGGMVEQLGIRDDIAKAVYKETYNTARQNADKGTVADKDSLAELNSQQELLTSICYTRAWKTMKAKVENAQELLQSCKKVLTRRMTEAELTKIGG
jgi:hypothetical protein